MKVTIGRAKVSMSKQPISKGINKAEYVKTIKGQVPKVVAEHRDFDTVIGNAYDAMLAETGKEEPAKAVSK